jgi:hypothetical protein
MSIRFAFEPYSMQSIKKTSHLQGCQSSSCKGFAAGLPLLPQDVCSRWLLVLWSVQRALSPDEPFYLTLSADIVGWYRPVKIDIQSLGEL